MIKLYYSLGPGLTAVCVGLMLGWLVLNWIAGCGDGGVCVVMP